MSGDSWTLIAIAVVALLVMAGAATVEASAGLISRQRFRQAASGSSRERSVQTLLDPRRSLVSALQLVQAIAIALAASLITYVIMRRGWPGTGGDRRRRGQRALPLPRSGRPARAGAHQTERHRWSAVEPVPFRGDARSPAFRSL